MLTRVCMNQVICSTDSLSKKGCIFSICRNHKSSLSIHVVQTCSDGVAELGRIAHRFFFSGLKRRNENINLIATRNANFSSANNFGPLIFFNGVWDFVCLFLCMGFLIYDSTSLLFYSLFV